jgi:hypothetical protein
VSQETRETASLHQILPGGLFHLLKQADGVKGLCHVDQFLLLLGRQDP